VRPAAARVDGEHRDDKDRVVATRTDHLISEVSAKEFAIPMTWQGG